MATKLKASRHDNSYYILEDTPFINLLQVPCHPRRLIFFCILFFGGDPARSCEGRTVPSMPPLPWPTLLCFSFRCAFIFENIVCEGTCSQFSLEVLVIAKPKSEPATSHTCIECGVVEAISLPTDHHTTFAMTTRPALAEEMLAACFA